MHLSKVNNRITKKKCEICSPTKTPERQVNVGWVNNSYYPHVMGKLKYLESITSSILRNIIEK